MCDEEDTIPPVHEFHLTVTVDEEHERMKEEVEQECIDRIKMQCTLRGDPKGKEEGLKAMGHPSVLAYGVYHPGLIALNAADSSYALSTVASAKRCFASRVSQKASLIVHLIKRCLQRWNELPSEAQVDDLKDSPLSEEHLPPPAASGGKRNKIIVFCAKAVVCCY